MVQAEGTEAKQRRLHTSLLFSPSSWLSPECLPLRTRSLWWPFARPGDGDTLGLDLFCLSVLYFRLDLCKRYEILSLTRCTLRETAKHQSDNNLQILYKHFNLSAIMLHDVTRSCDHRHLTRKSDLCTSEKRWYQKEKDDYLEILNQHISQKSSNLVTTGTFNRTMIIIIAEKL